MRGAAPERAQRAGKHEGKHRWRGSREARARGSAGSGRGAGRAAREGSKREHRQKTFPASKSRSEPRGTKQEPSSLFEAFAIRFFDLARIDGRSGTKRNQAGTNFRGANLPYEEPSRPMSSHLLYIILFKRWGGREGVAFLEF